MAAKPSVAESKMNLSAAKLYEPATMNLLAAKLYEPATMNLLAAKLN
jgi:hypothetical protein